MAEKEPVAWITINGKHVPIYKNDSQRDIYNRSVAKSNEDIKNRQIAENQRQSAERSRKVSDKNLALDDIPAEKANSTSDVLNLRTRKRFKFKDGTKITDVEAFAGRGCKRPFRKAIEYADKFGKINPKLSKASDWQHCSGYAIITDGIRDFRREVVTPPWDLQQKMVGLPTIFLFRHDFLYILRVVGDSFFS